MSYYIIDSDINSQGSWQITHTRKCIPEISRASGKIFHLQVIEVGNGMPSAATRRLMITLHRSSAVRVVRIRWSSIDGRVVWKSRGDMIWSEACRRHYIRLGDVVGPIAGH
ncbi:hypothetical protein CGRA01v4_04897 [Colletotrichum graminicola]|nr:hypothetical protein CGRA01v4_04897 [Colletotrichum graminicola]